MNAVIPTGEATDSDFGAFAEISLAAANKVRAAKHYPALAEEAAAAFKTRERQSWELYSAGHDGADRYTSVVADRDNYVRVGIGSQDCRESIGVRFTAAEARALASELVKAADALAGRAA